MKRILHILLITLSTGFVCCATKDAATTYKELSAAVDQFMKEAKTVKTAAELDALDDKLEAIEEKAEALENTTYATKANELLKQAEDKFDELDDKINPDNED